MRRMGMGPRLAAPTTKSTAQKVAIEENEVLHLLVMGLPASGKSTFLHQLKLRRKDGIAIHTLQFSASEIQQCVKEAGCQFLTHILEGPHDVSGEEGTRKAWEEVKKAIDGVRKRVVGEEEEGQVAVERDVREFLGFKVGFRVDMGVVEDLSWIWNRYPKKREFLGRVESGGTLASSAWNDFNIGYFLDNILRILSPDYRPTERDFVHLRQLHRAPRQLKVPLTKNLILDCYEYRPSPVWRRFTFPKYNGEQVAIMFLVDLSQYDKRYASGGKPGLKVALDLFDLILENNKRSSKPRKVFVFLNKVQEFNEKLERVPLQSVFPEYIHEASAANCLRWVNLQFITVANSRDTIITLTRTGELLLDHHFSLWFNQMIQRMVVRQGFGA